MNHPRYPIPAAVITLAAVLTAHGATARITPNPIDPVASVSKDGRQLIVTGPIRCDAGQRASIGVKIGRGSCRERAEGDALLVCTRDTQHWENDASTRRNETFQDGACTNDDHD